MAHYCAAQGKGVDKRARRPLGPPPEGEATARDWDDEVWKGRTKKRGRVGRQEARVTRDAPGNTGAGKDNSEKGAPAVTQEKLPQAVEAAGRETGTGDARTTATGLDEGVSAPKPAAQRSRLKATGSAEMESAETHSNASLAPRAEPLPVAAAAVAATGKRKRVADAKGVEETRGVEMGRPGIDKAAEVMAEVETSATTKDATSHEPSLEGMTKKQRRNWRQRHRRKK